MKRLIFEIKEGIYCSWCARLIKRTLFARFPIRKMDIDVAKSRVKMMVPNKITSGNIIGYLDDRGYHLREIH